MGIINKQEPNTSLEKSNKENCISSEELELLKKIEISNQELIIEFGQVEFQLQSLLNKKEILIEKLKIQEELTKNTFKSLESKYGSVSINTETGEITPSM